MYSGVRIAAGALALALAALFVILYFPLIPAGFLGRRASLRHARAGQPPNALF
jgi:hypothetical protein